MFSVALGIIIGILFYLIRLLFLSSFPCLYNQVIFTSSRDKGHYFQPAPRILDTWNLKHSLWNKFHMIVVLFDSVSSLGVQFHLIYHCYTNNSPLTVFKEERNNSFIFFLDSVVQESRQLTERCLSLFSDMLGSIGVTATWCHGEASSCMCLPPGLGWHEN